MQDSRTDRLLVMNDLGTPVMLAWRKHLQQVGWDNRCSNLVFDVRRTPFRDGSVAAITSVGGFNNIFLNRPAYAEAARVLSPGGQMLDLVRLYEEGGPTQQHLTKVWQAAATWSDYMTLLEGLGFVIQRWGVLNTGRGKTCPGDGLPLGDEAWEHRVVFAVQR
jgi:ubiquinone/menaquinone biosynthesis C-methylase UbiE